MYCINFAGQMLQIAGEFHPFGASVGPDGRITAAGAYNGEEHPNGQELYKLLLKGLGESIRTNKVIAVAIAANVNIPQQYSSASPDGLRVHLEGRGFSRFVYVPYRLGKHEDGTVARADFLEPFSVEISPNLFK